MNRKDWEKRRSQRQGAMVRAAQEIGRDTPLWRILGPVAWGRYDGEPSMHENKDSVIYGCGFLEGVRVAGIHAGRELNLQGTLYLENAGLIAREEVVAGE